jgi:hypothetical protein
MRGSTRIVPCWLAALGLVASGSLAGCGGPSPANVSGIVTVKGKPPNLAGLTINLLGPDGRPVTAPVAPDGSYAAFGLAAGETQVGFSVTAPEADAAVVAKDRAAAGGAIVPPGKARAPEPDDAPAPSRPRRPEIAAMLDRFGDPRRSGLATTTKPGANRYDVDIK